MILEGLSPTELNASCISASMASRCLWILADYRLRNRCERVIAALRADADRARDPRRRATDRACRESAA
jgi:hypothetical protein